MLHKFAGIRRVTGVRQVMTDKISKNVRRSTARPAVRNLMVAMALLVATVFSYGNSFHASWQYDDFGNIVHNDKVHMDQWSWAQLKRSLSAGLEFQTISRPLAYLSFALNHKLGGLTVFGYHVVNLLIHWAASFFIFLFIYNTLNLPLFRVRYAGQATAIAVIATVFWATHPIQVTAVTFIVQRMASMAGMFFIMAMYFYLKARTANSRKNRNWSIFLCGLATACALLTKENTLMLGYTILLYDLLCIQGVNKQSICRTLMATAVMTIAVVMVGLAYTDLDFRGLAASYDIRPFTMVERALTQPRVLFFYLSLIAVPMTSRMALLHDIQISHSLLDPWTTSIAIAGLLICIVALGLSARRYPLLSFCGFFFLLNHAVEGSILNLELIYEHRNYLPTMLIFVPPAIALVKSISFFQYRRSFQWMLAGAAGVLLISNGFTTFAYNRYFKSELSLWHHTVQCSPGLSLAHNNLGNMYWSMDLHELAYQEFERAFQLDHFNNTIQKGSLYYNLGLYAFYQKKDYQLALENFQTAKKIYNGESKIWYALAKTYMLLGNYETAFQELHQAIEFWPRKSNLHYLMSLIYLERGECDKSIQEAQRTLALDTKDRNALMALGAGYQCEGNLEMAIDSYERFISLEPKSLLGILALIGLNASNHNFDGAKYYTERLDQLSAGKSIEKLLASLSFENELLPFKPKIGELLSIVQSIQTRR